MIIKNQHRDVIEVAWGWPLDLSRTNLRDADLIGANLAGADLTWADLPDGWVIRQWSGCGRVRRMTTLAVYPEGHTIWCGCFSGTVDEFAKNIETTHDNPVHLEDYQEIVASMRRILAREGKPAQQE